MYVYIYIYIHIYIYIYTHTYTHKAALRATRGRAEQTERAPPLPRTDFAGVPSVMRYYTIQYNTILYYTTLHYTILYYAHCTSQPAGQPASEVHGVGLGTRGAGKHHTTWVREFTKGGLVKGGFVVCVLLL